MFSKSLHHFGHPNLSDEPRISISFTVMLKWNGDLSG
jgi:hypothetical protein